VSQISLPWQQGSVKEKNINETVKLAARDNHTLKPKIVYNRSYDS